MLLTNEPLNKTFAVILMEANDEITDNLLNSLYLRTDETSGPRFETMCHTRALITTCITDLHLIISYLLCQMKHVC